MQGRLGQEPSLALVLASINRKQKVHGFSLYYYVSTSMPHKVLIKNVYYILYSIYTNTFFRNVRGIYETSSSYGS